MNIVYAGVQGFPFGFAPVERAKLIASCLLNQGCKITFINRVGIYPKSVIKFWNQQTALIDIDYIYFSGFPYRPESFLIRNFLRITGVIKEIRYLYQAKRHNKLDLVIVSTMSFSYLFYIYFLGLILGFKVLFDYVEYASATNSRPFRYKLNDILMDNYCYLLSTGFICISDFLVKQIKDKSPKAPIIKVPPIADFSKFNNADVRKDEKYFLFCGTAGYSEIIYFILDSYEIVKSDSYPLYLIINGSQSQLANIDHRLEHYIKKDSIRILSSVPYESLIQLYQNASALLIPLRPGIQDRARFPHKIAEYTAAGRPIITMNFGEIPNYFIDQENALIAKMFDKEEFASKMQFIIENPDIAEMIGQKSRILGEKVFSKDQYNTVLYDFIKSL